MVSLSLSALQEPTLIYFYPYYLIRCLVYSINCMDIYYSKYSEQVCEILTQL